MKLKRDANGNVVTQEDMPVYIHDDGKEAPFDAAGTVATIKARNAEAKQHRERAEQAEGKLKLFEGIEDPAAALKALGIVKNLDDKKLVDAGEVEKIKGEVVKVYEAKLTEANKKAADIESQFHGELVGGAFARSKFLAEKTVLPADLAQAAFGKHFKVDGGKLKAVDAEGNPVFSRKNPGNAADFDEAIEILVDAYPRKDSILRGTNGSGSGAPANGGGGSGTKTMPRTAFSALDPAAKAAHMGSGGTVTD